MGFGNLGTDTGVIETSAKKIKSEPGRSSVRIDHDILSFLLEVLLKFEMPCIKEFQLGHAVNGNLLGRLPKCSTL